MLTFTTSNARWAVKTAQQDRAETSNVILDFRFMEGCEIWISLGAVQPVVDGLRLAAKGSSETITVTTQDQDSGYEQLSFACIGEAVRFRFIGVVRFERNGKRLEVTGCDYFTNLSIRDAKMLARDLETAADTIEASLEGNEARFLPDDPMGHPRVREAFANVTQMMMRSA